MNEESENPKTTRGNYGVKDIRPINPSRNNIGSPVPESEALVQEPGNIQKLIFEIENNIGNANSQLYSVEKAGDILSPNTNASKIGQEIVIMNHERALKDITVSNPQFRTIDAALRDLIISTNILNERLMTINGWLTGELVI